MIKRRKSLCRFLGYVDQFRKRTGISHGYIGQHLSVKFDASLFQPVDEAAVRQTTLARSGVDARNPQAA